MTNAKKRLESVVAELGIIQEGLNTSGRYPTCCLTIRRNGETSCEVRGPLPESEFLKECKKCRAEMRSFLDSVRMKDA